VHDKARETSPALIMARSNKKPYCQNLGPVTGHRACQIESERTVYKRGVKAESSTHNTHSFYNDYWEVLYMHTHLLGCSFGGSEGSLQQFSHHSEIAAPKIFSSMLKAWSQIDDVHWYWDSTDCSQ
jgi:hypothetical protein